MRCFPPASNGRRTALSLLLCGSVGAAAAEPPPAPHAWSVTRQAQNRSQSEWSATGSRLLTEKGVLPRLQVNAKPTDPAWPSLSFEGAITSGRLDYNGQTQSGVPLSTTSRHTDVDLDLYWRPLAPASWGEAWLGLGWLQARRAIASSSLAGGLEETSSMLMPAVRWRSPWLSAGDFKWQAEAQWRMSARHRLHVDYQGVFDNSSLAGGRRSEAMLRLNMSVTEAWQWSAQWSRTRQAASNPATLYLAGSPVGTVRQPKVTIDDIALSLTRRF